MRKGERGEEKVMRKEKPKTDPKKKKVLDIHTQFEKGGGHILEGTVPSVTLEKGNQKHSVPFPEGEKRLSFGDSHNTSGKKKLAISSAIAIETCSKEGRTNQERKRKQRKKGGQRKNRNPSASRIEKRETQRSN